MPSRREIATLLGVNINTVQRAFTELERESIIVNHPNRNSTIQDDLLVIKKIRIDLIRKYLDVFLEDVKDINVSFSEIVTILKGKY